MPCFIHIDGTKAADSFLVIFPKTRYHIHHFIKTVDLKKVLPRQGPQFIYLFVLEAQNLTSLIMSHKFRSASITIR